jgi:hypothetical protein
VNDFLLPDDRRVDGVLESLRAELNDNVDATNAKEVLAPLTDGEPDRLDSLLAELSDESLSPAALEATERVLANEEPVSTEARRKLISAVGRSLQYRRRHFRAPLQEILEAVRAEAGRSADDVASGIGIDRVELLELEAGSADLLQVGSERVARWIWTSHIDQGSAIPALRRSLELTAAGRHYGKRAPSPAQQQKVDEFVAAVESKLADLGH